MKLKCLLLERVVQASKYLEGFVLDLMVEVRVHLGHSEKRRNPRITPYIFTAKGKHKRKGIRLPISPARYQKLVIYFFMQQVKEKTS